MKYCLPIIKESKEEILNTISENPEYDIYEIWLSYIKDLDTDFVWKLSEKFNGKLIFLFRKQNLEKSEVEKELKEKIIKLLENSDNLMDLDINDGSEELNFIKDNKLENRIITSFHDYAKTPDAEALEKTVRDMENYKPKIYKFSTFCKTPNDAIELLTLLLKLKEEKKKFLIFGMGDEGKIVRIYAALWGIEFNFAPKSDEQKSAEGQLTKEKLERVLNMITNNDERITN